VLILHANLTKNELYWHILTRFFDYSTQGLLYGAPCRYPRSASALSLWLLVLAIRHVIIATAAAAALLNYCYVYGIKESIREA